MSFKYFLIDRLKCILKFVYELNIYIKKYSNWILFPLRNGEIVTHFNATGIKLRGEEGLTSESGAVLKWTLVTISAVFSSVFRIKHVSHPQNVVLSCTLIMYPQCTFLIRNAFSHSFPSPFLPRSVLLQTPFTSFYYYYYYYSLTHWFLFLF